METRLLCFASAYSSAAIAGLLFMLVMSGCARTPTLPNRVSADEYAVFSDFIQARFAKRPPVSLYLSSVTFIFDPLDRCGPSIKSGKVDRALAVRLHALGEAQYPLRLEPPDPQLRIPWPFMVAGEFKAEPSSPYERVGFSRAAFSSERATAYFAYSDSCGGLCGGGGAVLGQRSAGGVWKFEDSGCNWVY